MSLVHVVAIITAEPGKRAEVLTAFNENVPNVRAEDGCIEYGATIDTADVGPFQTQFGLDIFVVIEKWQSLNHLKAHSASPHMASYAAKTKDLIADKVIHVLSPA
ncbi:MAG: antibiotic biosynthesis monooxygenase [Alphaproteobacteria bacterium]|nr:antibiotic biosynthesis monooxygenase [Rhodospirillales bacterium]MCW9046325.1 antibiotic biosynthesis monooxygenase [Alphaproteobacteria bacterium]